LRRNKIPWRANPPQVEQVFRCHLAGHDALFHAPVGEGGNHFSKLPDFEPGDVIHQSGQGRVGLAFHSGGDDALDAGGAASRAKSSGNERLPAIRPMDSSAKFIQLGGQDN